MLMRPRVAVPEAELDQLPAQILRVHDVYTIQLPLQCAEPSLDTTVLPWRVRLYPLQPNAEQVQMANARFGFRLTAVRDAIDSTVRRYRYAAEVA
jgi:hypothetical protein